MAASPASVWTKSSAGMAQSACEVARIGLIVAISLRDSQTRQQKMDGTRLDRTDLALLAELQREGRLSNAELAERVKLSPSACLRRVQRLEQAGVLAGYTAVLDPAKLGLGLQAFVRVQLERHDPDLVAAFAERVNRWDEVVACHALTGDMDYLLFVVVQDLEHRSEEHTSALQSRANLVCRLLLAEQKTLYAAPT